MKKQLSNTSRSTNIEDCKREVTKLLVLRMDDSEYLKGLVESMDRQDSEVPRLSIPIRMYRRE